MKSMQNTFAFHLKGQTKMGESESYSASEELLSLLATRTRTLWRMTGSGIAQEIMAPHRQVSFCVRVNGAWQTYQDSEPLPMRVRATIGATRQEEATGELSGAFALPQGRIAQQAYRFFEARAAKA
jgi:hypothetical protein